MKNTTPKFGKKAKVPSKDTYSQMDLNRVKEALGIKRDKGVIKDKEKKISPQLQPGEAERYAKIFDIAKKIMFPGPETGQLDNENAKKATSKVPMSASVAKASKKGNKMDLSGLGMLPLLGFLALELNEIFGALGMSETMNNIHNVIKAIKASSALASVSKILNPIIKVVKAMGSFAKMIGGKLVPMMTKGFNKLVKGGKTLIKLFDGKAMQGLIKAYGKVCEMGASIAKFFGGPMGKVGKLGSALGKVVKGGGGLVKMFAKVGAKLGKALKFLPFIGSLFSFMASYQAFKDGRYGRGILELLSGVLNFIPGIGNIASGLLDGGMLLYDLLDESDEGGKSPMEKMGDLATKGGSFFKDIGAKIFGKLKDLFNGLKDWIFDSVTKTFDGIKSSLKKLLGIDDYEAPTKFDADPITYSKKSMKATNARLDEIKARVGEEEFLKNMRKSQKEREAWLATQGFVKATSIQDGLKKIKDGIITQNGVSTRIDSRDQVMALKSGGPIDQVLGENSQVMKDLRALNVQASEQRNQMIGLLTKIANKGSGDVSFSNDSLMQEFFA